MTEDFEIKIGEEIHDDHLVYERAPLLEGAHCTWGSPEQDPVRVILIQQVYREVNEHARSMPHHEVGGVLLGHVYRFEGVYYIEAIRSLPGLRTEAGASHLTFTPDTWSAVNQEREKRFPGLQVVGWYHSHPRMDIFFSGDDVFLHRNFFSQPWHIALVLEPDKFYGGFFIWEDKRIRAATGFYEAFDESTKSMVRWRNLPSLEALTISSTRRRSTGVALVAAITLLVALLSNLVFLLQTRNASQQITAELALVKQLQQSAQFDQANVRTKVDQMALEINDLQAKVRSASLPALTWPVAIEPARVLSTPQAAETFAPNPTPTQDVAVTAGQPDTTTTPPAPSAVASPTLWTEPSIALPVMRQNIEILQSGRPQPNGTPISPGSPVTFTFELFNPMDNMLALSGIDVVVQKIGSSVPETLRVAGNTPIQFAPRQPTRFDVHYSFRDPSSYVVYIAVDLDGKGNPVEVLNPDGQQMRKRLTVARLKEGSQ